MSASCGGSSTLDHTGSQNAARDRNAPGSNRRIRRLENRTGRQQQPCFSDPCRQNKMDVPADSGKHPSLILLSSGHSMNPEFRKCFWRRQAFSVLNGFSSTRLLSLCNRRSCSRSHPGSHSSLMSSGPVSYFRRPGMVQSISGGDRSLLLKNTYPKIRRTPRVPSWRSSLPQRSRGILRSLLQVHNCLRLFSVFLLLTIVTKVPAS